MGRGLPATAAAGPPCLPSSCVPASAVPAAPPPDAAVVDAQPKGEAPGVPSHSPLDRCFSDTQFLLAADWWAECGVSDGNGDYGGAGGHDGLEGGPEADYTGIDCDYTAGSCLPPLPRRRRASDGGSCSSCTPRRAALTAGMTAQRPRRVTLQPAALSATAAAERREWQVAESLLKQWPLAPFQ